MIDGQGSHDGNNNEHGPSILVHTSVPFGINNKDVDEAIVYEMILKHLNLVLPNLGNDTSVSIVSPSKNNLVLFVNLVASYQYVYLFSLLLHYYCFFAAYLRRKTSQPLFGKLERISDQ